MLQIVVPEIELFDEASSEFISLNEQPLLLEHSLVSLSKWESKWNKAFLSSAEKSTEEIIDYVRCMTITKGVNPLTYKCLTSDNLNAINEYINAPMTATHFYNERKVNPMSRDVVTSELIYYWMIAFNIPFECQKWHLNRLLTLIKVCNLKSDTKKMSKSEIMRRNKALNEARKRKLNTKG